MSDNDLLNCPFCGSETVYNWCEYTRSRPFMWMYCAECNAKGPRVMMQRNEQNEDWMGRVIAAWNNRTPDSAADLERAWQPIETAPRDGTAILSAGGGLEQVDICAYNARIGGWICGSCTLDDTDQEPEGYNRPTHWMPLPPPPADLAQRVKGPAHD